MKKGIYAEAENMFIDDNFRGKGLGGKFMKNFMKWCKTKKVNYVFVRATIKNKLGINFYRKCGFKDYDLILKRKLK